MKKLITYIYVLIFSITTSASEYQVDRNKENLIKFISDAPIEEFEGITNNIDGYINLPSFEQLNESQIYFEVDLETLDTGIGLRNRHMRENYLETEIFRYAFFDGVFNSAELVSENEYNVTVFGRINIHGIEKEISISGNLIKNRKQLSIETSFEISLTDFQIDVPELMFMKINENIKIECKIFTKEIDRWEFWEK